MKTLITSSGIIRDADKPRSGIISQHSVNSDFLDNIICNGIDLSYLDFVEQLQAEGKTEDEIQDACDYYESDGSEYLFGDWQLVNGSYEINRSGKHGFALSYSANSGNICVEYSAVTKRCHHTSPCYIMSDGRGPCGDLDTDGDSVVAYALPLEYLNPQE